MSRLLSDTIAPLVYLGAAVTFFFGVKFSAHRGAARAGAPLLLLGTALTLLALALELGGDAIVAALPFVLVGSIVGALLGLRVDPTAPPPALGFIFTLAGLGAALLAASAVASGSVGPLQLVASCVAAALGLAAAPIGVGLTFWAKPAARAHARLALAASLVGGATALLGVAVENLMLLICGGVAAAGGVALARSVGEAAGQAPIKLLAAAEAADDEPYTNVCDVEEAASILSGAERIVILPGFGMAAAQAQHALHELCQLLEKQGSKVSWLVHPSAGVVPGHINIVLDEAGVAHERLLELSEAGDAVARADVVFVVGASDVVNPAAANDPESPLWGLPVPDLSKVPMVLAIKRTLGPGASGAPNPLFEQTNTSLCFGDAKRVTQALVAEIKRHAA